MNMGEAKKNIAPVELNDHDITSAMSEISGFIDITPEDFREVYLHAFSHAAQHLTKQARQKTASNVEEKRPVIHYLAKMRGGARSPIRVSAGEIFWSWIGAFTGILAVAFIHFQLLSDSDLVMIIGSFGASAVLIYGAIKSPLAQPRNLLGGHLVSALIGVFFYQLLPQQIWLASAMSVATAIAVMHYTRTLHPPGGATALIAVIGSEKIHTLGYLYALIPVGTGAMIMLVVALVMNNLARTRQYPEFWL